MRPHSVGLSLKRLVVVELSTGRTDPVIFVMILEFSLRTFFVVVFEQDYLHLRVFGAKEYQGYQLLLVGSVSRILWAWECERFRHHGLLPALGNHSQCLPLSDLALTAKQ
jgi:hypothetical protein